jgi:hypothetical protein
MPTARHLDEPGAPRTEERCRRADCLVEISDILFCPRQP